MRARFAVLIVLVAAMTLVGMVLVWGTRAPGAGRAAAGAVERSSAVASGRQIQQLDCRGQRRSERVASLTAPDPSGARLFTRRQILCSFGDLRALRPGEIVAVERTTYRRAQAEHPALAAASPSLVNPSRVVWLITWYYPKPIAYRPCQYGSCPPSAPDRVVHISATSMVIDAATGSMTDSCDACTAAPRPRAKPARVVGVVEVCGDPFPHATPAQARHCTLQTGRVSILGANGHLAAHARLAKGRFPFSLPPGLYILIAWNEGNGPWKLRFTAVADRESHTNVIIPAI